LEKCKGFERIIANALICPHTMVIHHKNTLITLFTVMYHTRFDMSITSLTWIVLLLSFYRNYVPRIFRRFKFTPDYHTIKKCTNKKIELTSTSPNSISPVIKIKKYVKLYRK